MRQIAVLLAFSLGVFTPGFFCELPGGSFLGVASLGLAATVLFSLFYYFRQFWLMGFLAGLVYGTLVVSQINDAILPQELNNETVSMAGHIKGIPVDDGPIWRFEFVPETIDILSDSDLAQKYQDYRPDKIRLSCFECTDRPFLSGQHLLVESRLKRPHGLMNPGLFDYQRWLIGQGFSATGYIKKVVEQSEPRGTLSAIDAWRAGLSSQLQGSSVPNSGVQAALLIGDRQGISSELMSLFVNTGTIHLMVISGLHIGFAAAIGFFLTRWFLSLLSVTKGLGFFRPVNAVRWARLSALLCAIFYALAAGLSTPTLRAVVMLAALLLPGLFYLKTNRWWGLSLALGVVALMDPLAPLQNGFWLSFGAVVLIFTSMGNSLQRNPLLGLIRIQLVFLFGFSTMILLVQGRLNMVSFPANLIAVPLTGLLVVPLEMLGLLTFQIKAEYGFFIWQLAGHVIDLEITLLQVLHQNLQLILVRNPLPGFLGVISVVAGLVFFGLENHRQRALALLCMSPALLPFPRGLFEDFQLEVRIFDVGQGLSVLVRQPGYSLVYDTGARFSESFDIGADILAPGLAQLGLKQIDDLIISHPDADHLGGYRGLTAELPGERVWIGRQSKKDPIHRAHECSKGIQWQRADVKYQFIHPDTADSEIMGTRPNTSLNRQSDNDRSCVLKISIGREVILIPGDISAPVERRLLAGSALNEHLSLLIAPHHGSKSSSSQKFLDATRPRAVVFSSGYMNRFGHPHAGVVGRYKEIDSSIYNTSSDGMISFQWGESGVRLPVKTAAEKRIFWWQK